MEAETPVMVRSDWFDELPELAPARDSGVANYWASLGRARHDTLASLTRETLELLTLAAPATLIGDAQLAASRALAHTRRCWALAAHFGGDMDPAGRPLPQVRTCESPEQVLNKLIDEACVGRSLAALEIGEAAARCQEPALMRILTDMAEDVEAEAELGWRSLAWMLDAHPELVPHAWEKFRNTRAADPAAGPAHLEAMGVLAPETVRQARALALREVVRPAVVAIVGARVQ